MRNLGVFLLCGSRTLSAEPQTLKEFFPAPDNKNMSDPVELSKKAKSIIDSDTKDREAINEAVELYDQALRLQYVFFSLF